MWSTRSLITDYEHTHKWCLELMLPFRLSYRGGRHLYTLWSQDDTDEVTSYFSCTFEDRSCALGLASQADFTGDCNISHDPTQCSTEPFLTRRLLLERRAGCSLYARLPWPTAASDQHVSQSVVEVWVKPRGNSDQTEDSRAPWRRLRWAVVLLTPQTAECCYSAQS